MTLAVPNSKQYCETEINVTTPDENKVKQWGDD